MITAINSCRLSRGYKMCADYDIIGMDITVDRLLTTIFDSNIKYVRQGTIGIASAGSSVTRPLDGF
jgi:hypothetical protein